MVFFMGLFDNVHSDNGSGGSNGSILPSQIPSREDYTIKCSEERLVADVSNNHLVCGNKRDLQGISPNVDRSGIRNHNQYVGLTEIKRHRQRVGVMTASG